MKKLWFNNKKTEKPASKKAPVGRELSDDLLAQINGGAEADMSQCHTA